MSGKIGVGVENYRALVRPGSIAVVGATQRSDSWGGRTLRYLEKLGYEGERAAVNLRGESVGDAQGFRSLQEIPWNVEHVGIAVPAAAVKTVLEECAGIGCKAVTVFSNGFRETGTREGRRREAEIRELAARASFTMLGPNCNGIINVRDRVALGPTRALDDPALFEIRADRPGLAVVSQSGGIGAVNVMWRGLREGYPIELVVSTGNQAQTGVMDLVPTVLDDGNICGVLLVLEEMPLAHEVLAAGAQAGALAKPVVALKIGRSKTGLMAAESHTGSIAGEYRQFEALCTQAGVMVADEPADLYEKAFGALSAPQQGGIGLVSISGGNLALFADVAEAAGLEMAVFAERTTRLLSDVLPVMCNAKNPLDLMTAVHDPKMFREVIDALEADENVSAVVLILTLNAPGVLEAVKERSRCSAKPLWIAWLGGPLEGETGVSALRRDGIPVFESVGSCVRALRSASWLASRRRVGATVEAWHDVSAVASVGGQGSVGKPERVATAESEGAGVERRAPTRGVLRGPRIGGSAALRILSEWGLGVVDTRICYSAHEAVAAASQVGYPVVVKTESVDLIHKTEIGGVRLGISNDTECRRAVEELIGPGQAEAVQIQAELRGYVEMFVGATTASPPGPIVTLGLGGVLVEVLRDIVYAYPPLDIATVLSSLERLQGYPLLGKFRGAPSVDLGSLARWVVRFSRLVEDASRLHGENSAWDVDVNPLMVPRGGGEPVAVDVAFLERRR